ncbi:30S ribosomal protein S17, putative [Perkinsus marinus ATCC 50983]|uniref:30S ribosomal protein S17, putative n=2 Tax=Perkinsus marinus (strain ATCC 50983 / TXsc) TaxID=423536 RepID=C5LCR2_PERM5|nr:30S ribosomal protein S17, putative [Perkinsus marinus ATCC 50983]EER05745.1 30S ribosomal protein S17, putative [Perkinsus marinus ATCC 50983]|eukprot:XP_002773929.1 30S ribosomal protein S17, putative [Perkinsus marinus ATCC 50983]
MFVRSTAALNWHYKYWQRQTAGYLRTYMKNKMPGNEMIGFVVNDKHPKSVRVFCDRFMHVMRYKKTFRYTKKIWAHDENSECRLGDIVQVQPLGYRMGPLKTYVVRTILHQEPRDAGDKSCLRGSDARNLVMAHGEDEQINFDSVDPADKKKPMQA